MDLKNLRYLFINLDEKEKYKERWCEGNGINIHENLIHSIKQDSNEDFEMRRILSAFKNNYNDFFEEDTDLKGIDIGDIKFNGGVINDAFDKIRCEYSSFSGCTFNNISFYGCNFYFSSFSNCQFNNCVFNMLTIQFAEFSGISFSGCSFINDKVIQLTMFDNTVFESTI